MTFDPHLHRLSRNFSLPTCYLKKKGSRYSGERHLCCGKLLMWSHHCNQILFLQLPFMWSNYSTGTTVGSCCSIAEPLRCCRLTTPRDKVGRWLMKTGNRKIKYIYSFCSVWRRGASLCPQSRGERPWRDTALICFPLLWTWLMWGFFVKAAITKRFSVISSFPLRWRSAISRQFLGKYHTGRNFPSLSEMKADYWVF